MNPKLLYLLALTYVPGIGVMNQRKILKVVESEELWRFSSDELKEIFQNKPDFLSHFESSEYVELAQKEIEYCAKNGIEILSIDSSKYPEKLKECADSPLVLFKKGNYEFDKKLHIGIVGTRRMTNYGKGFIQSFIDDLGSQNIAIVSGLAYGCDIEAHRACINNGIENVAVLGHKLSRISPSQHKIDADKIIKNGALVSEYSSFHTTEAMNFVLRNRIIAGICDAVIVVESDRKGGSLLTATYANNYNREVFAVPGRIEDKFSSGCNQLIQSHQAYMIRDAEDLLNYFNLRKQKKSVQKELFIELEADEQLIYDILKKKGRQQVDELMGHSELPVFKLNGTLLNLELKGVVKPLAGKFFELS